MSATDEDSNKNLDLNQLDNYRNTAGTSQSNPELVARVTQLLERIEENEENIEANREEIESEPQTSLTETQVRDLIDDHAVTQDALTFEALRQSIDNSTSIQNTNDLAHPSGSDAFPSLEVRGVNQDLQSTIFMNFVKGSTIISTSLLFLFVILGTQSLLTTNIAAVFAGILSVSTIMFGKTWYDLPKN